MIAQSTLISYHTEAFVKTEVACTVFVCLFVYHNSILIIWPDFIHLCYRKGEQGAPWAPILRVILIIQIKVGSKEEWPCVLRTMSLTCSVGDNGVSRSTMVFYFLGCPKNFKRWKFLSPITNSYYLGQKHSRNVKILKKYWYLDIPVSQQCFTT